MQWVDVQINSSHPADVRNEEPVASSPRSSGSSRGRSGGGGRRDDDRRRDSRPAKKPGTSGSPPRSRDRNADDATGRRKPLTIQRGGPLPRWVREEIVRSTPKDRREAALGELSAGLEAFSEERYKKAASALRKAKDLAPRAATVRELLGLAAYRSDQWEEALRELRTFRRLTGATTHMPVELDCLRALDRPDDAIERVWTLYQELDADRDTDDEMRVVFASHLLDRGRLAEAWRVIKPGRLIANAPEPLIRRWAVAARVAVASGDRDAARTLIDAIRHQAPDVDWLDELDALLD
jgi:tetratricopeptide (TPR) repeat protein